MFEADFRNQTRRNIVQSVTSYSPQPTDTTSNRTSILWRPGNTHLRFQNGRRRRYRPAMKRSSLGGLSSSGSDFCKLLGKAARIQKYSRNKTNSREEALALYRTMKDSVETRNESHTSGVPIAVDEPPKHHQTSRPLAGAPTPCGQRDTRTLFSICTLPPKICCSACCQPTVEKRAYLQSSFERT